MGWLTYNLYQVVFELNRLELTPDYLQELYKTKKEPERYYPPQADPCDVIDCGEKG